MLAKTGKFASYVNDFAILYAEAVGLNWCPDTKYENSNIRYKF